MPLKALKFQTLAKLLLTNLHSLPVILACEVLYWNTMSSMSAGGESGSSLSVDLLLAGLSTSTLAELIRRFGGGDKDR